MIRKKVTPRNLDGLKKKNKYNAKKSIIDGVKFDSLLEADYYLNLKKRIAAKEIDNLVFHPPFPIVIDGFKICTVKLDFQFYDKLTKTTRYIDCKGLDTAISRLKRKIVQAVFKIQVEVWKKGDKL